MSQRENQPPHPPYREPVDNEGANRGAGNGTEGEVRQQEKKQPVPPGGPFNRPGGQPRPNGPSINDRYEGVGSNRTYGYSNGTRSATGVSTSEGEGLRQGQVTPPPYGSKGPAGPSLKKEGSNNGGSGRLPKNNDSEETPKTSKGKRNKTALILAILLVIVAGIAVYFVLSTRSQIEEAQKQAAQAQLDMEQMQLQQDYDELNAEFSQLENQRTTIMDDSVKRALTEKYETARLQVEKLQQELKDSKQKSAAEISKLKSEIETLRALLRHYVEEINRLNQENEALRSENEQIKQENQTLNTQVRETSRQNERLTERVTLAEKLNITGVSLTALNKKGKREKKVTKATQLKVTFTVPQNNTTPVGEKTFYLRIVSPSGQLLGSAGSFQFEGASVPFTARKTVEYTGEELTGVSIYYDVSTPLTAGQYTVEIFVDNYRLISTHFSL